MPNLWDLTDEEISQLGEKEIMSPLWNPEMARRSRMNETLNEAVSAARRDPNMRYRKPARIHDAATGKVTEDPGGWERWHTQPTAQPQQQGIMGGLAAMLRDAGGEPEIIEAAEDIESMPGGMELLTSYAAEEMMKAQGIPKKDAKKIRLYEMGGYVERARGGDVRAAAERTRRAGRGGDSVMLHMTPEEAEVIEAMWGAPTINPRTGIGEYGFLSKVWKKVKKGVKKVFKSKVFKVLAPIALSVFAPGIGTAIGLKLGLSGTAASIAGNALVQGGLGAITGGKKGAIAGAISGGLGAAAGAWGKGVGESLGLSGKTADVVGSAVVRGMGSELTGGDFTEGAITGGLGALQRGTMDEFGKDVRQRMGFQREVPEGQMFAQRTPTEPSATEAAGLTADVSPEEMLAQTEQAVLTPEQRATAIAEATPQMSPVAPEADPLTGAPAPQMSPVAQPDFIGPTPLPSTGPSWGEIASKYAMPIGAGLVGALGAASSGEYDDEPPPWWGQQMDDNFGESLPVYTMNRRFRPMDPANYFTYGQAGAPQSGQHLFLQPDPFAGERGTPTAPPTGLAAVVNAGQAQLGPQRRRGAHTRGRTGATRIVAQGGYMDKHGRENYWDQNQDVANTIPTVSREGGHHVRGPGTGRSDDIPALLSDGEYVIDAESVALLGDGSGDEGARRLDEMRQELRKHKGKNLSKGGFSHKAKKPAQYMSKVRKLRRTAKYEHGGLHNVSGTSPVQPVRPAVGGNI